MELKKPTHAEGNQPALGTSPPSAASPFRNHTASRATSLAPRLPIEHTQIALHADTSAHKQSRSRTLDEVRMRVKKFRFTKKSSAIAVISLLVAMGMIALLLLLIDHNSVQKSQDIMKPSQTVLDLEYQTVLPAGKSIKDLGGWKRVSPTTNDPVYAYTDTIGAATINVSEQPLPASFVGDTDDQVAELAKKFNATTKIEAGTVKVYIGSSARGPQSVIFTKNSLLILIKSQVKIDDTEWAKYVKSLN